MNYSFNLSYYDFANEKSLEDNTMTLFPVDWKDFFKDQIFINKFVRAIELQGNNFSTKTLVKKFNF